MGTSGGLVCSTYLFEILPQIPHWEQLTAAIPQLSGIGLQSLLWGVCWFCPFPNQGSAGIGGSAHRAFPWPGRHSLS